MDNYFLGKVLNWPAECFHPNIRLTESIGSLGNIEIESKALLKEHEIYMEEFKEKSL